MASRSAGSASDSARFLALDGWRGIAALFVALHHLNAYGHFYSTALVRHAFLFVDLFFVLSGFVLAHAYQDRVHKGADAADFAFARVARLWPLHAVTLSLLIMLEASKIVLVSLGFGGLQHAPFSADGSFSVWAIASNLLLLHGLGIHDHITWNWPSWSISTELYTNLLFVSLLYIGAMRWRWVVWTIILGSIIAVATLSPTYMATTHDFGIFRCFAGFFLGVVLYGWWRRVEWGTLPVATVCELGVTLVALVFVQNAGRELVSVLAPFVFALLIFVFAFQQGALSRALISAPMLAIGRWSYSIYLLHFIVSITIDRIATALEHVAGVDLHGAQWANAHTAPTGMLFTGSRWVMDGVAILYLVAVLVSAALAYRFIEMPAQKALRAWWRGGPGPVRDISRSFGRRTGDTH